MLGERGGEQARKSVGNEGKRGKRDGKREWSVAGVLSSTERKEQKEQMEQKDYRETLLLPRTDFPMRGNLPQREPAMERRWREKDLFGELRKRSAGRKKFILHDGPPYANGDIHMGTALNKVMKDLASRTHEMMGMDANYVPGWDCHGLPIEWRVEMDIMEEGGDKRDTSATEFRERCRNFARKWMGVQREQFRRLGIIGDWKNPYTTMKKSSEASIAEEFLRMAKEGYVYRAARPVMWAVPERTALAEAEVERKQRTTRQIWVRFPVLRGSDALAGADVVIWTTTPWTIPANQAVAYNPKASYGVYEASGFGRIIAADERAQELGSLAEASLRRVGDAGSFEGVYCTHPLRGLHGSYDFEAPMLAADFVETGSGSGFVHAAPAHGPEDFELGLAAGLEARSVVGDDGRMLEDVGLFGGAVVVGDDAREGDASERVTAALEEAGALWAKGRLRHEYPHSWRSGAPVVYRTTPQWFVSLTHKGLREKATAATRDVEWIPSSGARRIEAMIRERKDWVISRQRLWGSPVTLYTNKKTGEILRDDAVDARIVEEMKGRGADAWFEDAELFLAPKYDAQEWEASRDVLDVWFDSGCTQAFVLGKRADLSWPADLCLEGVDQHRGWFNSSLFCATASRGSAPYRAVLTHGFVLDGKGRKMSKSLGNVTSPQDVMKRYGADVLRLWAASSDYRGDVRASDDIFRANVDAYRKLRNALRFLLGNLHGYDKQEAIEDAASLPQTDRWALHRLAVTGEEVVEAYATYRYRRAYEALLRFASQDMSALYFDVRKDALYCEAKDSVLRRGCRTTLDWIFSGLTAWLAPILCFTAEEAWSSRYGGEADPWSVHLRTFPEIPASFRDDALGARWDEALAVRRVALRGLEAVRRAGEIGSSLDASIEVEVEDGELKERLGGFDWEELAVVSHAEVLGWGKGGKGGGGKEINNTVLHTEEEEGVRVHVSRASGKKCARSWKTSLLVGTVEGYPDLSPRDASVVERLGGGV